MAARIWALMVIFGAALPVARAQVRPGPAYFLRHPAGAPRPGRRPPAVVPAPALPATWGAVASVPVPAGRPPATAAGLVTSPSVAGLPVFPRRDATGVRPPYDLYRDLPEDFRKHTLPAVYAQPLPVQLLGGVLGR